MKKTMLVVLCIIISVGLWAKLIGDFDPANMSLQEFKELKEKILSNHLGSLRDEYLLEVLHQEWLEEQWENAGIEIYTYDENGFNTNVLQQAWLEGAWVGVYNMIHTNDDQGYPTETMWQVWEPNSQMWMDFVIMTYQYDGNYNMTEMQIQMWFGTMWMNQSKMTLLYNGDDNPTEILTEEWDHEGGTGWMNDDIETFTYDGLFLEEEFEENWENEMWNNSYLSTFTLAGNYHPADQLSQSWNGGGYWDNSRYSQYTYDNDWNEIEDFEQEWNDAWENMSLKTYTYNDDGMMIEQLSQDWEPVRNWENDKLQTITWGTLSAGEELVVPNLKLSNYPNPFNPTTTISFENTFSIESIQIEIYNAKGQIVDTLPVGQNATSITWDATNQASGIYFYKLTTDNKTIAKKMVLMK